MYSYRSEGCPRTAYFFHGRVWKGLGCEVPFPSRPGPAWPGPTRPDRAFRPPRFRSENGRFGAVGFGPLDAILGLARAIWASRRRFGSFWGLSKRVWGSQGRLGLPGCVWPPGVVFGLPRPFAALQDCFRPPKKYCGLQEPLLSLPVISRSEGCARTV